MPTVKSPPRGLREISCKGCHYVLEYCLEEVQHYTHDQDLGDTVDDEYDYIVCPRPACGKRTVIPKSSRSGFDPDYDL